MGEAEPGHGLHGGSWLHHPNCWGCGPRNDGGMALPVERDPRGGFRATFVVEHDLHGPPGRVHGGLLAVPMDCLASWAAIDASRARAVDEGRDPDEVIPLTGSYAVRLQRPAPTGVELAAHSSVERIDGRKLFVTAEVRHHDEVAATFESVFIEVPVALAAPPPSDG